MRHNHHDLDDQHKDCQPAVAQGTLRRGFQRVPLLAPGHQQRKLRVLPRAVGFLKEPVRCSDAENRSYRTKLLEHEDVHRAHHDAHDHEHDEHDRQAGGHVHGRLWVDSLRRGLAELRQPVERLAAALRRLRRQLPFARQAVPLRFGIVTRTEPVPGAQVLVDVRPDTILGLVIDVVLNRRARPVAHLSDQRLTVGSRDLERVANCQ